MLIERTIRAATAAVIATASMATLVAAMSFGAWSPPVNAESVLDTAGNLNTAALEGCPFIAQRDDILYFASNRAGGMGGLDIWYSIRGASGAWGDPVNFAIVNSAADELCPSAHRNGKTFLFVSSRAGGCGGDDLYMTRLHATRGWAAPQNLGCTVNSSAGEASPYLLETEMYFSSTRAGGYAADAPGAASGDSDLYVSSLDGESIGTPVLAAGVNTAQNDNRPNLRRDGLEIFFDSNRPGGAGGIDLWTSTRASTSDQWSPPTNLGGGINSVANDLRPSLSWDGTSLYFGSTRSGGEGSQDLYVSTR